ncbi:MAG: Fic family protein [Devosia sp.]
MEIKFSGPVDIILDEWLPEQAVPTGYMALIHALKLELPLPIVRSAISSKNREYQKDGWRIYGSRHAPDASLVGHLTFALKYEGVDLLVLKRLFQTVGPDPIRQMVIQSPAGQYTRRVGFLYEWLMGEPLDVPDAKDGRYVHVVDTDLQFGAEAKNNKRFRLKNNLPGTWKFCPLIRHTKTLSTILDRDLAKTAALIVGTVGRDVLRRAAAYLVLEDTKSTFEIEGEQPGHERLRRWGTVIAQAGRRAISVEELERLQRIVLENDPRFELGLRSEEGFIGVYDRGTHEPIPSHVSARTQDVRSLIDGMVAFEHSASLKQHPIIAATALAFGFVFAHPFADGNGRLHRYLIHHVLARSAFTPKGMIFPVSAVMYREIDAYRDALEAYSAKLLPFIHWKAAAKGNIEILNDTSDFYRYFDATPQAEFLAHCVQRTIDLDLPEEMNFLSAHDAFKKAVKGRYDLEERVEELAFSFLHQSNGTFSKRARKKDLANLTDIILDDLEAMYAGAYPRSAAPAKKLGGDVVEPKASK